MLLTVKNFTGTVFPLEVDGKSTVAQLKASIAEVMMARGKGKGKAGSTRQIETPLAYKDHELRDHQLISYYGIHRGDTLHVLPPSRVPKLTLELEKDWDGGSSFTFAVNPTITVAQLRKEISIEEGIEVTELKYISTSTTDSFEDDDEFSVATFEELQDEAHVARYQSEVIIVYTYSVIVSWGAIDAPLSAQPTHPIAQLRQVLSRVYHFTAPDGFRFSWDGLDLDENLSLASYKIPSGAILDLDIPFEFAVELAVEDDGRKRRLDVRLMHHHTLADLRAAVLMQHQLPISEDALVLVGRPLTGENTLLKDLGVTPGCTIHALGYISFAVEMWYGMSDTLLMHPLTRLSAVRAKLEEDALDVPLPACWFTLDGRSRLKESRTLWDLGVISGCTIGLRTCTLSLTIVVRDPGRGSTTYEVDAEEEETVSELKERLELVTGVRAENQQLRIGPKCLGDEETLGSHQLVGGETVVMWVRSHDGHSNARSTSEKHELAIRMTLENGANSDKETTDIDNEVGASCADGVNGLEGGELARRWGTGCYEEADPDLTGGNEKSADGDPALV